MTPSAALDSASEIVVFTIGLIAFMQAAVWLRHGEPGMRWFAGGSLMTTALVATGRLSMPPGVDPGVATLLALYVVRGLFAVGMMDTLGLSGRPRDGLLAVLLLPEAVVGALLLAGLLPVSLATATPLLWCSLGLALACALCGRDQPPAGRVLLALAPLLGPLCVALDIGTRNGVRAGHNFTLATIGFGIVVLVVGLMRRTRESRVAQAHAQRMSNYYAALSHTNQAILRVSDPVVLYGEICRVCVESAQAKMACVYAADGDFAWRVASAGGASRILATYPDPWDLRSPEGHQSYIVQAILEGRCLISNDYQADDRVRRWRPMAQQHGLLAVAVMPLRRAGRTVAALMVAAGERGIFDDALVRLLEEMAGDIGFALDRIDSEARHLESTRQVEAGLERFARLFQSSPVASAILSVEDRRVVDVNDAMCTLQRAPREALIGQATDALPLRAEPEDRDCFYDELQREGRVRNRVLHMTDGADGGRRCVELASAEPIDYLGRRCIIYTSLEITDMRAAEEARRALVDAQAASQAKTTFLSRMSHELRTPLNAVIGFAGLLRRDAAERLPPPQLRQLEHVQEAGWHLLHLIDDVLDLSRIEAGQFGVEAQDMALGPLLEAAIQMSRPAADAAGVTLLGGPLPASAACVRADPTRLRQVLLNVLSNAVKYNRAGGTVQVTAAAADGEVAIEIADTGLGMDPGQLAHLFEPFNRLGRDRLGVEGTGIGLSLTRQLMRLMQGDVTVRSELGQGTRVRLTLPAGDPAAQPVVPVAPGVPPAGVEVAAPRGTVLYIEDNAVNTLLVEHLLADWPEVRFAGAPDGESGLRLAAALRPDLVLLDLQLPDIDGMELLERLRAHEATRDVPLVVLSANAMPQDLARARERGATDYWTKPLDFQKFLAGTAALLPAAAPAPAPEIAPAPLSG